MQGFDTALIHHVAGNHRQFRPTGLDSFDCLHYAHGIAVCGVDDHAVNSNSRQCFHTILKVFTHPDCGSHPQATGRVTRGVGELLTLHDVLYRDETTQTSLVVDQRQFLDSMLLQQQLGLFERGALRGGDQVLTGHEIAHRALVVLWRTETHVTIGENADENALTIGDRHTRDLEAIHQMFGVVQGGGRRQCDRIGDHS